MTDIPGLPYDGVTDVEDLSGNGKGVALDVWPRLYRLPLVQDPEPLDNIILEKGEVVYALTSERLRVGDGYTPGGDEVAYTSDMDSFAQELSDLENNIMAAINSVAQVDDSNNWTQPQLFSSTITVTGLATFNGPVTFNGTVTIPDEVYSVAWNGKAQPATKNAVYDKIEALAATIPPPVDLSGYATDAELAAGLATKANVSELANYLPLSGGTLTGDLYGKDLYLGKAGSYLGILYFNNGEDGLAGGIAAFGGTTPTTKLYLWADAGFEFSDFSTGEVVFASIDSTGINIPAGKTYKINGVPIGSGGGGAVSDAPYGIAWDGDTTTAPSKNAVYDKIQSLVVGGGATLADGDYGDVLVSGTGTAMTVQSAAGAFTVAGNLTGSGSGKFVNYLALYGANSALAFYNLSNGASISAHGPNEVGYEQLDLRGSNILLKASNTVIANITATGMAVTSNISATGTISADGLIDSDDGFVTGTTYLAAGDATFTGELYLADATDTYSLDVYGSATEGIQFRGSHQMVHKVAGTTIATVSSTGIDLAAGKVFSVAGVPIGGGGLISVATVAALRAEVGTAGKTVLLTENGREGLFKFSTSNLATLVAIDTYQGVYAAPTGQDGSTGAWVRVTNEPLNVRWFGVVADNITDDGPRFLSAIALLDALCIDTGFGYGAGSGTLFIPKGIYYLGTSTLDLNTTISLVGETTGLTGGGTTVLRWGNATGIRVQAYNTTGASGVVGSPPDNIAGSGSLIKGLFLKGSYTGFGVEAEEHGIHLRGMATIAEVFIVSFRGDGIHARAAVSGGVGLEGNANLTRIKDICVENCRNGIYFDNADSNACKTDSANCSGNRQWGIWDSSFLGNTYIGCHTAANGWDGAANSIPTACTYGGNRYYLKAGQAAGASTNPPTGTATSNQWWGYVGVGGAYTGVVPWVSGTVFREGGAYHLDDNNNSASIFLGCYSEGDQSPAQIFSQTTIVTGGLHGAGLVGSATFIAGNSEGVSFNRPINAAGAITATGKVTGMDGLLTGTGGVQRGDGQNIIFGQPGSGNTYFYAMNSGTYVWGNSSNSAQNMVLNNAGNLDVLGGVSVNGSALATVSQLANYLPLTGGTVSGNLTVNGGSLSFGPTSGGAADLYQTYNCTNYYHNWTFQHWRTPGVPTKQAELTVGDAGFYFSAGQHLFRPTAGGAGWATIDSAGINLAAGLTYRIDGVPIGGTTTNALTFDSGGTGAASGATFNGSAAQTISYNTIGAAPATPLIGTSASSATLTPVATNDITLRTTQTVNLTVAAPSGVAINGWGHVIRIKATAAIATVTWNAIYRAMGVTLPTSLVSGKTTYIGMIYNSADSKWDVTGVMQEA